MTRARLLVCGAFGAVLAATGRAGAPVEKSVGELIRIAEQGDLKESYEALDKLAAIRDREALRQWKVIDAVARLARHPNPRKAKCAAETLGRIYGFEKAIKYEILKPMADILQDKDGHSIVRIKAAEQLAMMCVAKEIQDQSAIDALIKTAKPSEAVPFEVATACILAVGGIGDPRGRQMVRDSLSYTSAADKDAQTEIRDAAVEAFGAALKGPFPKEWIDKALAARIGELLRDRDLSPETRTKAVDVAALLDKYGETIPGLDDTLFKTLEEDTDPAAVKAALENIAKTGSEKAIPAFSKVYERFKQKGPEEQASADVRAAVCTAAGKLLDVWTAPDKKIIPTRVIEQAVDLLITAMTDADSAVRVQAVINLGNLYDTRCDRTKAVTALVALINAKGVPDDIKKYAIDSIEALTGRVLGDDPKRWEEWLLKPRNRKSLGPQRGR